MPTIDPLTKARIVSAFTQFDRKASKRKGYNPYALAHYCKAGQNVERHVANGVPLRTAIIGCFCGRLCDAILKALDLELMTNEECRYGTQLPELPEDE